MVKMDVFTSEEAFPREDLAAPDLDPNPISLHLRRSVHAPRQQLEVETADPVVLSGLHIQMRRSNMAKVLEVEYRRDAVVRPEDDLRGFRFFTKEGDNPAEDVAGFKMFNLETRNVSCLVVRQNMNLKNQPNLCILSWAFKFFFEVEV